MEETKEATPVIVDSVLAASKKGGSSTEAMHTEEACRALELLAQGKSDRDVAAETGIKFGALAAIKQRHKGALDVRKAQMAQDGFVVMEKARMVLDRKLDMLADDDEQLRKLGVKDAALTMAVLQDKALQAAEGHKVVVEHTKGKPSLADAKAFLDELRNKVKEEKQAEAVEV